ncbi:MAG: hypothetical protein MR006_01245 [Arcanobacterium sp.]|nr:hypothetical protein [Arcanobacterium sp.]MDY5589411.1 hypothetical protein [Arcanobacterium sp.]
MAKKIKSAGAFDIRNVIGILIDIYGVALVLMAFFMLLRANAETSEPKNLVYSLYAGIALLAVCAAFLHQAKLRLALVPGRYQSLQHAESTADSSAQAESSH